MVCRFVQIPGQFWRQATQAAKETTSNRSEARNLKQQLLEAVGPTQRGVLTTAEQREEIDRLITALERRKSFNNLAPSSVRILAFVAPVPFLYFREAKASAGQTILANIRLMSSSPGALVRITAYEND